MMDTKSASIGNQHMSNCNYERSKMDRKPFTKGFQENLKKNTELKQKYNRQVEILDGLKEKYQKMLDSNCKCETSKMDRKPASKGFQEKLKKNTELKQNYRIQVEILDKLKEKYQKMLEANCYCSKPKRLKVYKSEGLNEKEDEKDC